MEADAILGATRTDADLASAGDRAAFGRLVVAHNRSMERVAYVIVGDAHAAQDAVQSAWLTAWQRIPNLREPGRVGAWLVAIAANEARQLARKRQRRSVRELDLEATSATRHEPTVATEGIARLDLVAALRRLRPEDRELLALRYVAGFDAAELGRLTGRSASGVRGRLSRLTSNLRKDLTHG
jgi:RNA polymerase sigma-70 factor (ECF subfamily)